jgi:hypothetical protein
MTTRTKRAVCLGLLVLAVGVVLVRSFPARPPLEVSFVRYTEDHATAIVHLTNRTKSVLICEVSGGLREVCDSHGRTTFYYFPDAGCTVRLSRCGECQLEVSAAGSLPRLCIHYRRVRSDLRQRLELHLSKVGINIASTGFVATVTLPPRLAATSPRPTNQNTP